MWGGRKEGRDIRDVIRPRGGEGGELYDRRVYNGYGCMYDACMWYMCMHECMYVCMYVGRIK